MTVPIAEPPKGTNFEGTKPLNSFLPRKKVVRCAKCDRHPASCSKVN